MVWQEAKLHRRWTILCVTKGKCRMPIHRFVDITCMNLHYVHRMCLNIEPCYHMRKHFELTPKTSKTCILCNLVFILGIVMVYKETPSKFYLHPSHLCTHLLLLLFFSDCLWLPSPHSQIFKYLFAGGCVSSQQMTQFLHTHNLANIERPLYIHQVSANTLKFIPLFM